MSNFHQNLGGQFALELGGQFAPKLMVNLDWKVVVNLTVFSKTNHFHLNHFKKFSIMRIEKELMLRKNTRPILLILWQKLAN